MRIKPAFNYDFSNTQRGTRNSQHELQPIIPLFRYSVIPTFQFEA
jgi:hypothetical protein